jgi:hypothetical protein
VQPARRADNSANLVVPNVRLGRKPKIPPHFLSLHNLLRKGFTYTWTCALQALHFWDMTSGIRIVAMFVIYNLNPNILIWYTYVFVIYACIKFDTNSSNDSLARHKRKRQKILARTARLLLDIPWEILPSKHCLFFKLYEHTRYQNTNVRGNESQVKQEVKQYSYTLLTGPEGYMKRRLPDFKTVGT